MQILITGGAGFVGSNLAIQLKEKYSNYSIICLDNLKRRGSELNLPRLLENKIKFIHGDIRCPEDFTDLPKIDFIIDASAEPSVLAGISSSVKYVINNNLIGTLNCLELAKKHNAGFVFLSTSRVYPIQALEKLEYQETETRFEWIDNQFVNGVSSRGISEKFPLNGSRSFYGATKLASELLIQEYCAFCGLKTVINRFGVIAGPWQMGKIDQGIVVYWLARHLWKKPLTYIGYGGLGKQVRDILHIQDVFRLIDYELHNINTISGETFNVGGGQFSSISLQELTKNCETITGNKILIEKSNTDRIGDLRIYLTDNEKNNIATGWKPELNPEIIVKDIYDWMIKNESILKPILDV